MWAGPLHDKDFIQKLKETVDSLDEEVYKTKPRIQGTLSLVEEELDVPFYRTPSGLSHVLHCQTPSSDQVWSALANAGYKVSSTHCLAGAFKTDAPAHVLWDMMKAWVFFHPVSVLILGRGESCY